MVPAASGSHWEQARPAQSAASVASVDLVSPAMYKLLLFFFFFFFFFCFLGLHLWPIEVPRL